MDTLEIVVLVAGAIIFILGFLLPAPKENVSEATKELAKEEVRTMVSKEMDGIKGHVEDVVDEAVGYAVEKTERSLERLTNEKIMAVNEYSDTVLKEIHKNHEEVMFLYDMLNSKHTSLKNTVSEVNKTVKEAAETTREAEEVVNSFQKLSPESITLQWEGATETEAKKESMGVATKEYGGKDSSQKSAADKQLTEKTSVDTTTGNGNAEQKETTTEPSPGSTLNSNDKILELYRMGKTEVAIAKELGIGVGEVQLVVGLFKKS